MNSIQVIVPYKLNGMWVFDDADKGIKREAFVGGADAIIDVVTHALSHAENGFNLIFSDKPFPGHSYVFRMIGIQDSGYMYNHPTLGNGWLCSVVTRYFENPPERIYVQVREAYGHNPNA